MTVVVSKAADAGTTYASCSYDRSFVYTGARTLKFGDSLQFYTGFNYFNSTQATTPSQGGGTFTVLKTWLISDSATGLL